MNNVNAPLEYDSIDGVLMPSQTLKLYGHRATTTAIEQMRQEGRLHHALLFEGPKGIGKATLAFHLAWNIASGQSKKLITPDTNSIDWRLMVQNSHPKIAHISRPFDTKTERFRNMITVEEIRNVMHFLTQTSSDGGWRVVLIDSADDMNRNASNALLKTLEEPPAKVIFILISHYAGRLLPTIRSRCQTHMFHPLSKDDLTVALQAATNNTFNPTVSGADIIIEKAEGSVRQAALLINYGGLEIMQTVDELLSTPRINTQKTHQLAHVLSARDATIQYQQFCDNYLDHLSKLAQSYALQNQQEIAAFYAKTWQDMSKEISEADAYNLDKKQFIITLLNRLHNSVHKYQKI